MKRILFLILLIMILLPSLLNSEFRYEEQQLQNAVDYIFQNDTSMANKILDRLIYISSDHNILMGSYFWKGYICYTNDNFNIAIIDFKNSIKHSNNIESESVLNLWIGKSYYQINNLFESEKHFSLINKNNISMDLLSELMFYKALKDFKSENIENAIEILSEILTINNPSWIQSNIFYAYYYLKHYISNDMDFYENLNKSIPYDTTGKLYLIKGYIDMNTQKHKEAEISLCNALNKSTGIFYKYSYLLLLWDYILQNRYDIFTEVYNSKIDIPEYNESILFLYGYSLEKTHKYDKAIEIFDYLIDNYPQSKYVAYSTFFKALSLFNLFKYQKAIDVFKNFEATYPPYHTLYSFSQYFHALSLYKINKFENAIENFNKIIISNPSFIDIDRVYYMIAKSNLSIKNNEIALTFFNIVIDSFPESTNYNYAKYNIAITNYNMKRYKTALKLFKELIENDSYPQDLYEDVLFYSEKCRLKIGYYNNIVDMAFAFIKKYPNTKKTMALTRELSVYYKTKGEFDKLLDLYIYLIDNINNNEIKSNYLRTISDIYISLNDYGKAILSLQKLPHPEFDDKILISNLFIKSSKYDDAIQLLTVLLKSVNEKSKTNIIYYNIAECYKGINQYNEAGKILNNILKNYGVEKDSFYIQSVLSLSNIYAGDGLLRQAETLLANTAQNTNIMQYDLYIQLAKYIMQEDNYPNAIKILKNALNYTNNDNEKWAYIYYLLGTCYFEMAEFDESLQYLDEAKMLTLERVLINEIMILKAKVNIREENISPP